MGMYARDGGPGGISLPFFPFPLPAPARHWSVESCGPKADSGKDEDESSLETHPMMGTVRALAILCLALSLKKSLYDPTLWFSKYQSAPVFQVLSSQL